MDNMLDAIELWNSSSSSNDIKDLSHWRGHGRWANDGLWKSIGENSLNNYLHILSYAHYKRFTPSDIKDHVVLEWGTGGGSNAFAFCPYVRKYYGVDISLDNLTECQRQVETLSLNNFEAIKIEEDVGKVIESINTNSVDFFLSTAVFQHFPGRDYAQSVLNCVNDMLCNGGSGLIQIRYDDGRAKFTSKAVNYKDNFVTFTSFRLEDFWKMLKEAGLRPRFMYIQNEKINYATYFFTKRP